MITVYGRGTCAPCKTLLYWLGRKNIDFKYIDCSLESPGDIYIFPTVIIGDNRIEGLNFSALNHLLS